LAKKIAELVLSKKAFDVVLMDMRKLSAPADFFVVCSADSDTQVKAIADAVRNGTDEIGAKLWHSEGFQALSWVLLDYVDVVVHIFHHDSRSFYNIERLWGDATMINVQDTPEGAKFVTERATEPSRVTSRKRTKIVSA
jgi:ribosome-associated protein